MAVLYFENATRDSADAYVADGLTEAIIVRLGALERLQVKSRGAVRPLREGSQDPSVVGSRLKVAYLVTGSVRRVARRLLVTVELVRSANGVQVWAHQYDRSDGDVLALEQDIAGSVAAAIAGRLLPGEKALLATQPTRVPEAYNQFLRGHYFVAQRTPDGFAHALSAYEAAVRADPAFTAAMARIAYVYALAGGWEYEIKGLPPDSLLVRGLAAVDRALRADSATADAWLALGLLKASDRRYAAADVLASLDRAVAHDPRSAEAHHMRGWFLFVIARDSLAHDAWHRALSLEPERPVTIWNLGRAASVARKFPECIALADSALALDRGFGGAYELRATCRALAGDLDGARADAGEALRRASGGEATATAAVTAAFVDLRAGDTVAVRRRLVSLLGRGTSSRAIVADGYAIGALHAFLGERALAVAALQPVHRRPRWNIEFRQAEWDRMRDYPPFMRLVDEMNRQLR